MGAGNIDRTKQSGETDRNITRLEEKMGELVARVEALEAKIDNTESVYVASTSGGSPTTNIEAVVK
jgi:predicted RNase H-like nuclease (RuvC/YqgF family)